MKAKASFSCKDFDFEISCPRWPLTQLLNSSKPALCFEMVVVHFFVVVVFLPVQLLLLYKEE